MGRNSKARKAAAEKKKREEREFQERYERELEKLSGQKRNGKRDFLIFVIAIAVLLVIWFGIGQFR